MVAARKKLVLWWRRSSTAVRLVSFFTGTLLFAILVFLQRPREESQYPGSNLLIFVFVNLIIVFLLILAFVVGRNVVKLIFDRRRRLLGSRLRLKLVSSFVALILVPTALLFALASGLLNTAMEGWFTGPVDAAVNSAVDVAREHYALIKGSAREGSERVRKALESRQPALSKQGEGIIEELRQTEGFFGLQILAPEGRVLLDAHNANAVLESFKEPPPSEEAMQRVATKGETVVVSEEKGSSYFIRVYSPIRIGGDRRVLLSTLRVSPEFSNAMEAISTSKREYEQFKFFKNPLKSGYLLTLAIVTGLILFSAIWAGFYIAREISVPIQELAEGADAVSRGNYDFQIKAKGDDEIGFLVKRFNQMTSDLNRTTKEAERRRLFIESILSNLAVGVIALDTKRRITSVNEGAARVFGIRSSDDVLRKDLSEVLSAEDLQQITPLLEEVESGEAALEGAEKELRINSQGRELKIICTAGAIASAGAQRLGTVLLFDDVTELAKAQHMSVWREVARRIAHEIKNPLTPIQLSAQRLQKLFGEADATGPVNECTQTIVEHVDSIKRLANEFSNFARMPTAEFQECDLNVLITDTISSFAENHSRIVFQFVPDEKLPSVSLDKEQIRRIFINLIDNAVAAIEGEPSDPESESRITVRTNYDRKRRVAIVEVLDTGPGFKSTDKTRIFEPYYTTKKGGTGLGLAIVTSILADHQGTIRVYDNTPTGAKFIVELPLVPKVSTQRRLVH